MPILAMLFYGIGVLAGLAGLVCFIMVLIQMFKRAGAGMGIVGIITCSIGAFIWGWIKAKEYDLKRIMLAWTVAIGVGIICNVIAGIFLVAAAASNPEIQDAFKKGVDKGIEEAGKKAEEK